MAETSKSMIEITPKKYVRVDKYCCFLCGSNLPDAKKRARINSSLAQLLSDILESELDRGYLCNDDCYKKMNRFATLRTSLAELSKTLKGRHVACKASLRCKRGVPSDVKETVVPTQRLKGRTVKSLNFQPIAPSSTCVPVPVVSNTLNYSNLPPFQGFSVLLPRRSNVLQPLDPLHPVALDEAENIVCKVEVSLWRTLTLIN